MKEPKWMYRFRCAVTGQFVKVCEALKRPATTIRERWRKR